MVRRLCALALSAVIVGAPAAAAVCQVMCTVGESEPVATAMAMPMAGHVHHPASSSPPTTDGVRMTPSPQICGHPFEGTVGLQQTLQVLTAPALVSADVFSLADPIDRAVFCGAFTVQHSPPGASGLITQLRL